MADHNAILAWGFDPSDRFEDGFFIGSEGPNGEHVREAGNGWPWSIYKRARQPGVGDQVLCHGIQSLADAATLLALVRAEGSRRREVAARSPTDFGVSDLDEDDGDAVGRMMGEKPMSEPLLIPTVHLNGTSKAELVGQIAEAVRAIENARQKLAAARPNGRDYYTQSQGAIAVAARQATAREERLKTVLDELTEIWERLEGVR